MDLGFNLKDWEQTEAIEVGERETLELGGHEVKILDARLHTNEQTGNKSVKICVDIDGNDEQKGFFKRQYDNNTLSEAKWPRGGTRYLSLKSENLKWLKGLTDTILPNSNPGFKFDTNKGWDQINGLKCAAQFGLVEYETQEGNIRVRTELLGFRSLDKLNEIKVPDVKMLNGTKVSVEEYNEKYRNKDRNTLNSVSAVEVSDSDLPF